MSFRLRAATSSASFVTQLLMLSHKHLCAFSHMRAAPCKHLQNYLIVFLQISLLSVSTQRENNCKGSGSCGRLKSCCEHHCPIVSCAPLSFSTCCFCPHAWGRNYACILCLFAAGSKGEVVKIRVESDCVCWKEVPLNTQTLHS